MSGDVQPRKRKKEAVAAARRKKDSEGDILSRKLTAKEEDKEPTVSGVKSLGQDDVQMHVQNNHGTGGHWCAKIVFFFLLAVLLGLVGLIILENRGQSDLDTPLSESRYSEILEGWVQEDREVFDEHDAAEALNELDNHDHDNEPFEEEPDVSGEEDHDDHDEEGEEAEHSEEEEEVNEKPSATAEEEDGDDVDPQSDEDKEGDDDEELNDAAEDPKPDLGIREKRETVTDPEVNASDEEEEEEGDNVSVEQRQEIPHQHVPFEEVDDDSDDESQKQNAQDEDDDEDNASLEPVIDNDNGEEEHLQRLAEQNKGPVADDAATEQEPESSTASQLPPLPRGQQANAEEAELSADEFRRANQFINNEHEFY